MPAIREFTHRRLAPGAVAVAAAAVAAVVGLLAACGSMAPPYQRPALPVPASYPGAGAGVAPAAVPATALPDLAWRSYFGDPALQAAIAQALAHNRDLRMATLRVTEARTGHAIQRSAHLPNIGATVQATRAGLPDSLGAGLPAPASALVPGAVTGYASYVGVSSWEIDLWGRVDSLSDAAQQQYFAARSAQRAAAVSLIAQTANAWLALREADERLALARQALANRAESLRIFERRVQVGSTSRLELTQVQTLHQQAQALTAQLLQWRATQANALQLLTGVEPAPAGVGLPDASALAALPPGLPSELLTRRPDVMAAEHLLQAAHAQIGAARAAFLPKVSLTGLAGAEGGTLGDLFSSGSRGWLFQPSISVPLFTAGRLQHNLELSEIRRDSAVAQYEKTIQGAFRDVADALAAQQGLAQQVGVMSDTRATQAERARLSRLRYEHGATRYFEVLDAERDLLATEQQLVQLRRALLASRVGLYAALGGGADAAPEPATIQN